MAGFLFKTAFVLAISGIYLHMHRDTFDAESLKHKNVFVTGASSGIGEEVAYQYARYGANVFITARRENLLKEVVANCKKIGRSDATFQYIAADMSKYETAKTVINAAVKKLGGLDHIILNHALLPTFDKKGWVGDDADLSYLQKSVDINFMSYAQLASAALPHLFKSKQARIGVVGSLAGKIESPGAAPYSATKFALDGFFSTLRMDLKRAGKEVEVTLCPLGFIETEGGKKSIDSYVKTFKINEDKLRSIFTFAESSDTALGILKAVTRGDREFYYPRMLGIDQDAKIIPIIRHIMPEIFGDGSSRWVD